MKDGEARIRQITSGEVMHPSIQPWEESLELYVKQSRLIERLQLHFSAESRNSFVIWDVGLGAATNAMATLTTARSFFNQFPLKSRRKAVLQIYSFENDLDSLRLALENVESFPHLRDPAPANLLENGFSYGSSEQVRWDLVFGDFMKTMRDVPQPDLI